MRINLERRDENTGGLKQLPVEYSFKMRIYRNQRATQNTQCPICKKLNVVALSEAGICAQCLSRGLIYNKPEIEMITEG